MEKFEVTNGILFVKTDLDMSSDIRLEERFQSACQKLLQCDTKELYIDLTKVKYISSLGLGIIMGTFTEAQDKGKELIVKVAPKLHELLSSIAANVMQVKLVENPDDSD